MIHTAQIDSGQIEIENQGEQTRVSLSSGVGGSQHQAQSNSFSTGQWTEPPALYRAQSGYVLQISTSRGTQSIRIDSGGMKMDDHAPAPDNAQKVELQQSDSSAPRATEPMKPMEPMRMGDMEMKPGEMRMGNMRMSMGGARSSREPEAPPVMQQLHPQSPPQVLEEVLEAASKGRFCTQCGERAQSGDTFCGACGNKLRPLS